MAISVEAITPEALTELDKLGMEAAFKQARLAIRAGEVPIGASVICDGSIIAQAFNQPIAANDPTAHAEVLAIREACEYIKSYRLTNSTLYVTLMPCLMCLGSILQARVPRVVVALAESRFSLDPSEVASLLNQSSHAYGDLSLFVDCRPNESKKLLEAFFASKRPTREQTLSRITSLSDLPNVDKLALEHLEMLGIQSGGDLLSLGIDKACQLIEQSILEECLSTMPSKPPTANQKKIAMLKSLVHYLKGNPATSWKLFL